LQDRYHSAAAVLGEAAAITIMCLNVDPLAATYEGQSPQEAAMARHWRKASHHPPFQFISLVGWLVVGSVVLATLVLLSRHIYI
jgi:hypothetical protein